VAPPLRNTAPLSGKGCKPQAWTRIVRRNVTWSTEVSVDNSKKTVKVSRVRLDGQGYDRGGRYFGTGPRLFHFEVEQSYFNC
jgi:hypothetical protein